MSFEFVKQSLMVVLAALGISSLQACSWSDPEPDCDYKHFHGTALVSAVGQDFAELAIQGQDEPVRVEKKAFPQFRFEPGKRFVTQLAIADGDDCPPQVRVYSELGN